MNPAIVLGSTTLVSKGLWKKVVFGGGHIISFQSEQHCWVSTQTDSCQSSSSRTISVDARLSYFLIENVF